MNESLRPAYSNSSVSIDARNRCLRQTYTLLAVSLIPTALGAWIGMASGLAQIMGASPGMSAIVFLAVSFGFMFAIEKFKNSGTGVALLLGFTFFMGLMLSRILGFYMGMQNGVHIISMAFGGTAVVFGAMAVMASMVKRDLSGMAKWLTVGVIIMLVAGIANIWLQLPALMLTVSVMGLVIFSAFMMYDIKRIIDGGETNYISATLALYLDVYNVFVSLLQIFGFMNSSSND